ncbi:hypothetical protein [uncultured Algibacter sp.]|uniref:hypothetical protein n=1 Tax=uncultured Algibacter sp. TaxID=298659 RepID=UPI002605203F|nr:hypothetical protein [uncultured Algibacter sp.]
MRTKFFSSLITCILISSVFAQKSINNYKYVIVPNKYDFLKENDQYQLNSLTQFLFEKYGFEAIMEGTDYPEDLNFNRCLALDSDVIKDSSMFTTKLKVVLKDCNGKLVYESVLGISREKEFKIAYNKALREAFKSFETVNYSYRPDDGVIGLGATAVVKSESEEIKQLKQQIQELESEKEVGASKVSENSSNASLAVPAVVATTAVVAKETPKPVNETVEENSKKVLDSVLYAQKIENGYQLVDSSPKVVYKVKKTNLENVFLVEGKSAVVFKIGDDWVVEYYENNVLKQKTLNIKF